MVGKSYEDLEIYQRSYELAMNIHDITLRFPKYELYEEGNQIRKSSKSIVVNIVEGFGRRRYKNEIIKFLTYAHASCDETKVHLNFIFDSGYIQKETFNECINQYENLGRKINQFLKTVEKEHKT
ncbi:four helix bundle protein [[Eubacterium] cellulosolvens]